MSNKEFVTYKQALALKELGFDEMCFGFYSSPILELMHCKNSEPWMGNGVVSAPLKQQVFRWFRENYELPNHIDTYWQHDWNDYSYQWSITENHIAWTSIEHYKTYEEAENACIDKLIELIKQQDNG